MTTVGRRVYYDPPRLGKPLSRRESEVLALLARGDTNEQIARKLGITYSTTVKHIRTIFDKLGVANRVQAALESWRRNGDPDV
jgi:DNA-binding NarL/FixJ family response regulator